jgi:glycosyltransferase involved in cell wall biosynthesis
MPLKNAASTLQKAIDSVLSQQNVQRPIVLLVGNDASKDDSLKLLNQYLPNPQLHILNVNFGKAYLNRNFLNQYARAMFPNAAFIGRLDADDFIASNQTIAKIETIFDATGFDVFFCGNYQSCSGQILPQPNKADKRFLQKEYLIQRLWAMAQGDSTAELASCNVFIRPTVTIEYPSVTSAEDHWFSVLLLLEQHRLKIQIDENLLYCVYSLSGELTHQNLKKEIYLKSRLDLYHFFKNKHHV